jgi:hypothetical protein
MDPSPLTPLVGEELSSVEFIRDYVSLHFDGPRIDVLAQVIVNVGGRSWRVGDSGWRDALCSAISQTLARVSTTQEWVTLNFEGGTDIRVGIVPESDEQPEAAIFHASNGDMFFL